MFLCITVFVAGCGSKTSPTANPAILVKDDLGKEIKLEKPAARIISLYAAHTENLFSLGLDQEIIGVSTNESYPKEALQKPVFDPKEDPEKVIAAKPDLVLIRTFIASKYPDFVAKLESVGIPVVTLYPENTEEFYTYLTKLGALTGKDQQAQQLVHQFKASLTQFDNIVSKIPQDQRKRIFFETTQDVQTCTPDSNVAYVLAKAGAVNIASDAEAVKKGSTIAGYGVERLLTKANDIDVYLAQRGAMNRAKIDEIMQRPGYGVIKAVKDKQVYVVDENLVSRPTMRLIQGISEIGHILYPSHFPAPKNNEQ